jgi:membrane protein
MHATRLLSEAYGHWTADRIPQTAAALAYYTVFSIAPLLLIAIGIAGLVLGEDTARAQILSQATALVGERSAEAIERMMGDGDQAQRRGFVSTILGFATLLVGAVGVLAQLKSALNTVWNVETGQRSWSGMASQYLGNFALVFATGFLLLVSLIVSATIGAMTAGLRSWLAGPDVLWIVIDGLVGLALATAIFAVIFKAVPDADVHWNDVWVGAVFTAVLFTVGRLALGWYLGREGGDSAYSAAGSLLALLAWVYYSSQLVLFGAEFTFVYASHHGSRRSDAAARVPADQDNATTRRT